MKEEKKIIQHYCSRTSIALGDFFEVQKCLWQSRAPHQGAPYIKRTPWASDWKSTLTTSCKAFMQISPWPNHSVPGQERPNLWYGPGTVSYASGASQGVGSHCRLLRVASSQRAHRGTWTRRTYWAGAHAEYYPALPAARTFSDAKWTNKDAGGPVARLNSSWNDVIYERLLAAYASLLISC